MLVLLEAADSEAHLFGRILLSGKTTRPAKNVFLAGGCSPLPTFLQSNDKQNVIM
jgi:hypothetical protein